MIRHGEHLNHIHIFCGQAPPLPSVLATVLDNAVVPQVYANLFACLLLSISTLAFNPVWYRYSCNKSFPLFPGTCANVLVTCSELQFLGASKFSQK